MHTWMIGLAIVVAIGLIWSAAATSTAQKCSSACSRAIARSRLARAITRNKGSDLAVRNPPWPGGGVGGRKRTRGLSRPMSITNA